jgi:hypothetical protein
VVASTEALPGRPDKAFFEPYAKATGAKVTGTTGTGHAKIKAMVVSGNIASPVSADAAAYEKQWEGCSAALTAKARGIPADSARNTASAT